MTSEIRLAGAIAGCVLLAACATWTEERLLHHMAKEECDRLFRCDDGSGWIAQTTKSQCVADRFAALEDDLAAVDDGVCFLRFNRTYAGTCADDITRFWNQSCDAEALVFDGDGCFDVWTVECN